MTKIYKDCRHYIFTRNEKVKIQPTQLYSLAKQATNYWFA